MPFFEEYEPEPEQEQAAPGLPPIDFRAELNDDQYAAVTAEPGPALVLAGAGSGKTRTLTYRVAYLLHMGVQPGEILLLTFTNKAAREMLERVEQLTGVERHRFWGGTFHHVGHKILRAHGELVGLSRNFTLLDEGDAEAFLRDVVDKRDAGFFKDKTRPRPSQLGDIISLARNKCVSIAEVVEDNYPQHSELVDRIEIFAKAYAEEKLRQQVTDYDDFLEFWLKLLKTSPQIAEYYRNRFHHLLVDEYQDTNFLQASIVDLMASNHRVMAVGDDAQCIYSWRGANFENFATFPDRHPGTTVHKIEINYRSTPQILALANGVLVHQVEKRGFEKTLRAQKRGGQKPCFVQPVDTREQAWFVVNRIRGLRNEGRDLKDVAVLYRAHYQAVDLQLELSKAGIDYQITSGVRFFESAHIRDLVGILRFINNPADMSAWKRIVMLLPKVGDKGADKLHTAAAEVARAQQINFTAALFSDKVVTKVPKDARGDWDSFAQSLKDLSERSREQTPDELVQLAVDGWYGDYLRGAYPNYQNRLDDLGSLVTFAARYEELSEMLTQITLLASETSDRSADPKQDAVRLTTVHQAKGLEYDVVFVLGLADGQFPLKRAIEAGDIEEERRLFYVAVTRAREELYLCSPKMTDRPPSMLQPSRFVQEVDPSLYEVLRLPRRNTW